MHAEHALKAMLDSAHVQTSQLEDVGSAHQAANVESLVDLRNQLEQTGERLTEEVLAREAASGEIARQLQREVDAREQVISAAADAAAAANRATQQVLRTEIRARMKGEASLSTQQKAAAVEAANAMAQVQSSLDEEAMATKKRFAGPQVVAGPGGPAPVGDPTLYRVGRASVKVSKNPIPLTLLLFRSRRL